MTTAIVCDRFADVFGNTRGTREDAQAFAIRQASGLDGEYIIDQMKSEWGTSSDFAQLDNQGQLIEQALLCISAGQESVDTTIELTGFLTEFLVPARGTRVWGSRVWRAGIELNLDFIRLPDNPAYVRNSVSSRIKGCDLSGLNAVIDKYYANQAADFFAHAMAAQKEDYWMDFEQYDQWREAAGLVRRFRKDALISKVVSSEKLVQKHLYPWLLSNIPRDKTLDMLGQIIFECAKKA